MVTRYCKSCEATFEEDEVTCACYIDEESDGDIDVPSFDDDEDVESSDEWSLQGIYKEGAD